MNLTSNELDAMIAGLPPALRKRYELENNIKTTPKPRALLAKPNRPALPALAYSNERLTYRRDLYTNPQAAGSRGHWIKGYQLAKAQREFFASWLFLRWLMPLPVTIRLVRVGRRCDDDNIPAAFKSVRDGLADGYGVNDDDARITWAYGQTPRKTAGVIVEIETRK